MERVWSYNKVGVATQYGGCGHITRWVWSYSKVCGHTVMWVWSYSIEMWP